MSMKLNIYEFEIVVRKKVRIAARNCSIARECAEERERSEFESVTLASVQENVNAVTMTADVVDCITFASTNQQDAQQITAPDRLPHSRSGERE